MLLCDTAVKRCLVLKESTRKRVLQETIFVIRCCIDVMLGDNMRRFILHVVLCLGCAFASCLNVASAASNGSETSSPPDEDRYQAYVEKIAEATREDAVYHTPPQYPPSGESFDELAAAGAENIDFCIRYLAESKETGRQKLIALYSMYQLGVDDYVVFVRKLAKLYHSGLLFQRELSEGIHRYSDLPVEQYNNPKIQALFKEMAAQEDIPPDIKEEIRYIRSGEGFAETRKRDFDRQCMRWSEMRSISACVSLATQTLTVYAASWMTW